MECCPPPEAKNIVESRTVLNVKHDEIGYINHSKVRLVVQGYCQVKGAHYDGVFSPLAQNTSVRLLLALANAYHLEMHLMTVKTAFQNGSMDCEIYMSKPEGFVDPDRPNHVCMLMKSIFMDLNSHLVVGTLL